MSVFTKEENKAAGITGFATILTVDVRAVAHSVKWSLGKHKLSKDEKPTFVIFGFLNRLIYIAKRMRPDVVAFTLDSPKSLRRELFPGYKLKEEKKKTPQMQELDELARPQMIELDEYVLPSLGFRNIFIQEGYESDDILAHLARRYRAFSYVVIATNDQDMYQCLHKNVSIFNLRKNSIYNKKMFKQQWGISPKKWAEVKSLAGCTSDTVPGIKGVKEKTAIKYINNELNKTTQAFQNIVNSNDIRRRNKKLVKLPFKGLEDFKLKPDHLKMENLKSICKQYGFKTILKSKSQWKQSLKFK